MAIFSDLVLLGAGVGTVYHVPANDYAQTVYVNNYGATVLLVGHGTAAGASYPINAGGTLVLNMGEGETLYGFASSGTCEVRLLAVTGSR